MTEQDPAAPSAAGSPPVEQFTSQRAALQDALDHTPHLRRDRALIALAFRYADLIDDMTDRLSEAGDEDQAANFRRHVDGIARIGARLESTLNALGMAPGARAATRQGDPQGVSGQRESDPAAAALDRLQRAAATAGIDYAAVVDPAVAEADAGD